MEQDSIKDRVGRLEESLFEVKNNTNQVVKRIARLEEVTKSHSESFRKSLAAQEANGSDIKLLRQAVPIALVIGCVLGAIIARIL